MVLVQLAAAVKVTEQLLYLVNDVTYLGSGITTMY